MAGTALVVGSSGIVGSATAELLLGEGWTVYGLSRRPTRHADIRPIAADLQDKAGTAAAIADVRPDAVFITAWARQDTEAENIRVNGAMVRNLLDGPRADGAHATWHWSPASSTTSDRSRPTQRATCRNAVPRGTGRASTSRTSTMRRRTRCSPPPPATASPGASIGRTRSSACAVGNAMNMGTHARRICDPLPRAGRPSSSRVRQPSGTGSPT